MDAETGVNVTRDAARQRTVRAAVVQLAHEPGEDPEDRFSRVLAMLEELGPTADLVVLPELWLTGYFNFDRYSAEALRLGDERFERLGAVSQRHGLTLVAGTFVLRDESGLANCAVVFDGTGRLVHTYRKVHLFGYGSREAELLVPGAEVGTVDTSAGNLAATTCYDLRFPELYRVLVDRGAQIIVVPAAWPAARTEHWRVLLRARAIENQAFVIGCNGAGVQAGVELAGHSVVVSPWGEVLGECGAKPDVLRVTFDAADVERDREEFPVLDHRRFAVNASPTTLPPRQPAG